jgi:hypothetical protein
MKNIREFYLLRCYKEINYRFLSVGEETGACKELFVQLSWF